MSFKFIRQHIFNIAIIAIFLVSFGINLKLELDYEGKEKYNILSNIKNTLFQTIKSDIKKIILLTNNEEKSDISLDLIKNYSFIEKSSKIIGSEGNVTINDMALLVGKHRNIQIDLFYTYSLLHKLIPPDIGFYIIFNGIEIIKRGEFIKSIFIIDDSVLNTVKLEIGLSILPPNIWYIASTLFLKYIFLYLPCLGAVLYFYKRKELKNWHELYGLKKEHKNLALERELLFKYMKSRKSYNNLLFNGIREGFKNDLLEEKYDSVYLFPILVNNSNKSKIDTINLEEEIRSFFGYQLYSKAIELSIKAPDIINTQLAKESFYQLIYSLLNILLDLLPKNSRISLEIKGLDHSEISIKHTGVFVDMEKMKLFASKKNHGESLLLNIEELFRSLEIHKIDYSTSIKSNVMLISLKERNNNTNIQEKDKYKVINISDYSK